MREIALGLILLIFPVFSSSASASAGLPIPASLCDVENNCGILMGSTRQQPKIATLVNDIIQVLGAPEYKWVRKGYTPQHADPITEDVENDRFEWKGRLIYMSAFLSDCYKSARAFASFLLPRCHSVEKPPMVEKHIHWDLNRKNLMGRYLLINTGSDDTRLVPKLIVTHWTGGGTLQGAFNEFYADELRSEKGRPSLAQVAGRVNYSCHYIVDRDGKIYHLMSDHLPARHVIGLNQDTLCVENVGGAEGKEDLTSAQEDSTARLIEYLVSQYPSIEAMIGHLEYHDLKGTELFAEKLKGYDDVKPDPGRKFLKDVRQSIRNACGAL